MADLVCKLEACERPVKRFDLCYGHYMKLWRYGDPEWVAPPRWTDLTGQRFGKLTVLRRDAGMWLCGCDCGSETRVRAGDLNRGTASSCATGDCRYRTERPHYFSAHSRVYTRRGPASAHPCVGCGGPARHWSYDHEDEDELVGPVHGMETSYSADPAHYQPRCVPCHKRFDLDWIARESA